MQTRTYSALYALIEAFCGVQFSTIEQPRIKALVNSRAQKAYDECSYWPRWLKVAEERVVTNSVIPFTETDLSDIGEFLRVFVSNPYGASSSQEYDFSVTSDGCTLISANLEPTSAFVTYRIAFDPNYGDGQQSEDTAIPAEWFQYLAHGTYADFLRAEGQQEKALVADQEAEDKLSFELMKPEVVRSSQLIGTRISTNLNMQSRSGSYFNSL